MRGCRPAERTANGSRPVLDPQAAQSHRSRQAPDGKHARIDGFVSLGVLISALLVALGAQIADPIIGLAITIVILKITWDSWHAVRNAEIDLDHIEEDDDRTHR